MATCLEKDYTLLTHSKRVFSIVQVDQQEYSFFAMLLLETASIYTTLSMLKALSHSTTVSKDVVLVVQTSKISNSSPIKDSVSQLVVLGIILSHLRKSKRESLRKDPSNTTSLTDSLVTDSNKSSATTYSTMSMLSTTPSKSGFAMYSKFNNEITKPNQRL